MSINIYPTEKRQRPHTTVTVNGDGIGSSATSSQKALVLMGSAKGGTPNTVYQVSSYTQAKNIFRGGELLDAIEMAWNPSDEVQGAGMIYAIRVDTAVQASITRAPLVIKSVLYGRDANNITVALEDNAITSTKRLRVVDTYTNTTETFDNLGGIFHVKYTGEDAVALATIKDKVLTIKSGADAETATTRMTYNLASPTYDSVYKIISDISSHEGFEASFVPFGDKDIPSVELDEVTDLDIKTGEDGGLFTGLVGDIILQTSTSALITVARDESPATTKVENFAPVALEGGSDGDVPTSWAETLAILGSDDAPLSYYIVPVTDRANVHAEVATFVKEQNTIGYPMRAFVGGAKGETYAQIINRKNKLFQDRVALVGFEASVRMGDGRVVVQPPYMMASMIAGVASGGGVGEPITYKGLRIVGLESTWTSDQLDQLHINGVIGAEKIRTLAGGATFRLVSDPTTYNVVTDPVRATVSLGEESDFLAVELREMLDRKFKGRRTSLSNPQVIKSAVYTFLLQKKNANEIVDFDGDNISVAIVGNRAEISAPVIPAVGLDYINATLIYVDESRTA